MIRGLFSRAATLGVALLCACRGERGASSGDVGQAVTPIITSAAGYREIAVPSRGSVSGTISLAGAAPEERPVRVTQDEPVCGDGAVVEPAASGGRVANAVVWLEGITAGKPRSRLRRYEVSQVRCMLEPRVQAVEARGTVNVKSQDPIAHRTRFLSHPGGQVISVVSEVDAGQVVPDERIAARPGLVEIRCEQHPWTHGWIAVFDQPYYAVTAGDGSFAFDDVPPGTYTLAVWHERGARVTRQVTVREGSRTTADIALALR